MSTGAVSQWLKRARDGGGREALRTRPHPGSKPKLTTAQRQQIPELLAHKAAAFGFIGAFWTTKRMVTVIHEVFGVRDHPARISRFMRHLRHSVHLPVRSASGIRQPSKPGMANAGQHSRKAAEEGRTMIWVDEAGIYLLSARVRTYAPVGVTSTLSVPLKYAHLSAISGITSQCRLLIRSACEGIRGPRVVRFLRHVLRQIAGQVLVIWDGAPIHRCQVVKSFLASGAAARLWLEPLPAYAPDLNPDEGLWRYLNRDELAYELRLATTRLRHKRSITQTCITHVGYVV